MPEAPLISVVVPVYNSRECLKELVRRIESALTPKNFTFEIVLVNDGSPDDSWEVISGIAAQNRRVIGVCLRRNFGQDSALMAGLRIASGTYIVIMDDDLQHDPAYIPALYEEIVKGYDVVYATYNHKRQKFWKNLGSAFNDRIANIVLKKPKEIYLSPYKIIFHQAAVAVIDYDGPFPYVDGLLFRITSHFSQIEIEHDERFSGAGNYTILKSLLVWSNLLTNFSIFPLRIATMLGLISSASGILYGVGIVVAKLLHPAPVQGWTSTIVTILILGGVQLFTIGMMGEYLGRVYLNISRQPQYVIKEIVRPKQQ